MTSGHVIVELIPWDDFDFVRLVEQAREQALAEGLIVNGPRAAERVEVSLRAAGYTAATVECERTVDEAMVHAARWTVRRDGPHR
jgi:hypothetical protein